MNSFVLRITLLNSYQNISRYSYIIFILLNAFAKRPRNSLHRFYLYLDRKKLEIGLDGKDFAYYLYFTLEIT